MRLITSPWASEVFAPTERGGAILFPANNQELTMRVHAHAVAGRDDRKVSFTVYSEKESKFMQKPVA